MPAGRPERRPAARWGRAVAAALLLMAAAGAQALGFDELMGLLAQTRSAEARFYEQRYVHGLDAPLVSQGTLSFAAPDRFVRNTTSPRPESMAVQGQQLTLTRSGRSRTMAVDALPEVQAIVEAIRGTLNGNATVLRAHFTPVVSGSAERWQLVLTPREPRLQKLLAGITLGGSRTLLQKVEMRMADGDSSVMQIETTAVNTAAAAPAGPAAPAAAPRP